MDVKRGEWKVEVEIEEVEHRVRRHRVKVEEVGA
jgi:hypothetical protein